jgi:hypothetical protein
VHTKEDTPMALDESAVADPIEALAVGEGTDLVLIGRRYLSESSMAALTRPRDTHDRQGELEA